MTSIENAQLKMFQVVEYVVSSNPEIFCSSPHLCELHNRFKANTSTISDLNLKKIIIGKGASKQKGIIRQQLCESTATICHMSLMYAHNVADSKLEQRIYHSKRKLLLYSKTKLLEVVNQVNREVAGLMPILVPFGITTEILDHHTQLIKQFVDLAPSPQQEIAKRKEITRTIKKLFKENNDILQLVDTGINLVKDRHSNVYVKYRSARKITVNSLRHLALRAHLLDSITLEGIKGVKVILTQRHQPKHNSKNRPINKPLKKITGNKGIFNVRLLPKGEYDVVATMQGYQLANATITIEHGTMFELNLLLVPIPAYSTTILTDTP